ncbi:hypothetical protein LCGC14_2188450 [marine sediment metagenome]|uniref:Uncharacterized protein n=1 Tax=marine sediment metagenome TaxID=412755 RepID=A0A0F9E7B4_9ZZZZ
MDREGILGAVARGWCSKKNENKVMDPDLVEAITDEIMKLPLDIETELTALYNDCTDKQRRLEVLCELHRIRQELGTSDD